MKYVAAGAPFEASVELGESGLVGTLEYAIVDNDGNVVTGPTATLITENLVGGTPTGNYTRNDPAAPAVTGEYQILWSKDGTFSPVSLATEELIIVAVSQVPTAPPLVPPQEAAGPSLGPCAGWITTAAAAECCSAAGIGSDVDVMQAAVDAATQVLYEFSGRQFLGVCDREVRPCDPSRGCGLQVLEGSGHVIDWRGDTWYDSDGGPACSCGGLSRVLLPNYPVRSITEVKLDGVTIDPGEYRLDGWQWLTRLADADDNAQSWPRCQRLDLRDDELGTFSVRYAFGQNPPQSGVDAAGELACQIYLACPGSGGPGTSADCLLPSGVTRITRQGVTIEMKQFRTWAWSSRQGWHTGLPLVDLFLSAYNPNGLRRRPALWSPDGPKFGYEVGTAQGS